MTRETCIRKHCNQPAKWQFLSYCSKECERLDRELAQRQMIARLDGEEPPEMKELLDRNQRAKRWTPETMESRVEELKEQIDGYSTRA